MFASKLPGSNELSYGDQEKDANVLLMELDKGLRSIKTGEQCEAIVRFPRLFEKYPFPILINSAFLKLADLFRVGSNFLRQCILKVTQQSEKHLDKIINVEEFLRRIYAVIHSNDPVARAITLRTLGQAACIISERKNVHHSIINGLDSHDAVEQEAAIFAVSCFAAQSKSFAGTVCDKLEEMIEGLVTPLNMKLQLIPIFQYMHHDADTTRKVMRLCMNSLLPCYPSRPFVRTTLQTMSLLTAKSLINIPQQIELLLQYLNTDCRVAIKLVSLNGLQLLSRKSPHMWSEEHIHKLCEIGKESHYSALQLEILKVLITLSKSVAVGKFSTEEDGALMEFCTPCCYHSNVLIASYGARLFTNLAVHTSKGNESSHLTEDCATVLDMLVVLTSESESHSTEAREVCMSSIVQLCRACPDQTDRFVDTLMSALNSADTKELGSQHLTMAHCLIALSSSRNTLMPALAPELSSLLSEVTSSGTPQIDKNLVLAIIILLFQTSIENGMKGDAVSTVNSVLAKVDSWTAYKIARQATRYGHSRIAVDIFKTLANQVSSEHFNFWLTALKECCLGDSCLQGNLQKLPVTKFVRLVSEAEIHYHNAVSSLKAASTPSHPLLFQVAYLQHRAEMLQVLTQAVQVCCSFQTSPPPAIATSLALTSGQDFHRCRHVITQLKKCQSAAESLSEAYSTLYKSSFDADEESLTNIQVLQEMCHLLIHVLETVFVLCKRESATSSLDGLPTWKTSSKYGALEYNKWGEICNKVLELVKETIPTSSQATLTHHHIYCIEQTAKLICSRRLTLPRYMYQQLQATDIKLAFSPQPRAQNEPISIHYDTCLTLKVEGVIQHGLKSVRHRQIKAVHVSVVSAQQSKASVNPDEKVQENPTNEMLQVAETHNDYFSCHFLLSFPVTGLHQVRLETSVQDDSGAIWHMGSPVSLTVKSYDEAAQRQQQQQYAAQRQQQRATLATTSVAS